MKYISIEEASKRLSLANITIRRQILSGELKASKIGQKYVINEDDLKEFLEKKSNRKE